MADLNLIKQLRNMTQAGFQDCKIAIEKFNGNLDEACKYLREKGLAKASKKANCVAAEGAVLVRSNKDKAIIIEINTQTDFVAQNESFIDLSNKIADALIASSCNNISDLKNVKLSNGNLINDECQMLSGKMGEKIEIRRFEIVQISNNQDISIYQHMNKKYGSIVLFDKNADETLKKQIAMHIVARNPKFVNSNQVDQKWLSDEKEIIESSVKNSNKPSNFLEKIVLGKLKKRLAEVCLYDQEFDFQPNITVGGFLNKNNVNIIKFIRYELGEGIEIIKKDFSEEVAQQIKNK